MRPSHSLSVTIFMLLACASCAETAIPVDVSRGAGHTALPILMDRAPTFEDPGPARSDDLETYRLFGELTALLSTRPPGDRLTADRVTSETVTAHRHHVTRSVVSAITRRLAESGHEDLEWHTRRVADGDPVSSLDAGGLQVRYGYELEVRARPAWVEAVTLQPRSEPTIDVEIPPRWWGDSVSTSTLAIEAVVEGDAFLPCPDLAADGVLDIAIHVGTNTAAASPMETPLQAVGQALLALGFEHPSVASRGALTIDGEPFVRKALLGALPAELHVTLIAEAADRRDGPHPVSTALGESLAHRDVVILRDLRPAIGAAVLQHRRAPLAGDGPKVPKAQLVILEGASIPEAPAATSGWTASPSRRDILSLAGAPRDLGRAVDAIIAGLTLTDAAGRHIPVTVAGLLRLAEDAAVGSIHTETWGLADNPRTNPYGAEEILCQPCTSPWGCGAAGNLCLEVEGGPEGDLACGLACAGAGSCPEGFRCAGVTSDPSQIFLPRQCVPRSGACSPQE